jgi:hypothetical protein
VSDPLDSPLNPTPSKPSVRDNRVVRIRLGTGRPQVEVSGRDIADSVDALQLDARKAAGELEKTLTLDLKVERIDVGGTPTIRVPQATHDALVAIGWTPPPAQPPTPNKENR